MVGVELGTAADTLDTDSGFSGRARGVSRGLIRRPRRFPILSIVVDVAAV